MTLLDEDQEFLAHYGKKGMRWGQRKSRTITYTQNKSKPIRTPADKQKRRSKAKIAGGVVLAAGSIAVAGVLAKQGNAKVSAVDLTTPFKYKIGDGPFLETLPQTSLKDAWNA